MSKPTLIPISGNNYSIIDEDDLTRVSPFSWHLYGRGYASAYNSETGVGISLHRFIMNAKDGETVDHKNHNGLDNRKSNLRLCTQKQNSANRGKPVAKEDRVLSSQYKGVSFRNDRKRWTAYIGTGRDRDCLGCFSSEDAAAEAYNKAALEKYGAFAKLNVIGGHNGKI